MTSLSDLPPDVQAAACSEALKFIEWLIPAPHDYAGSEDVLAKVIASAIIADRAARIHFAGLTPTQAKCLQFIADYQAGHGGIAPSYDEIGAHMGIVSKSGVTRLIDQLEMHGRIARVPNRSRAITIIPTPTPGA